MIVNNKSDLPDHEALLLVSNYRGYHVDHFAKATPTNEERMTARKKELNNV